MPFEPAVGLGIALICTVGIATELGAIFISSGGGIENPRPADPPRRGTGIKPGVSTPGIPATHIPESRRDAGIQPAFRPPPLAGRKGLRPFGTSGENGAHSWR